MAVGLQDLLSGKVLRRFVEQIIEHAKEEVFSLLPVLEGVFISSIALRGAEPRCAGQGAPFSDVTELVAQVEIWLLFLRALYLRTLALVRVHATVYSCFWKNFYVDVDPNPEADRCSHLEILTISTSLLHPAVTRPGFCVQSTETYRRISRLFYVKANSDPDVHYFCGRRLWRFDGVSSVLIIFRAPPGRLELSASFSSPRALTPVRNRGLLPIGSLGVVDIHSLKTH